MAKSAPVARSGQSTHLRLFTLPAGVSLETPDKLGQSLAEFLRANNFGAKNAVVGVPARWLIAVDRELPPADETQARAMLRLQAERLAVAESGEMVFDYVGGSAKPDPSTGKILLVGIVKKQLDRITQAMNAAGLNIVAITSTALTLAQFTTQSGVESDVPMLMLGRNSVEVVFQNAGSARMLRHVSIAAGAGTDMPAMAPLGADLRRTVALASAPMKNGKPVPPGGREVLLWDALGLSDPQRTELAEKLGYRLRAGDLKHVLGDSLTTATEAVAPAIALAVAGTGRLRLPLDFAHTRLAEVPKKRIGRGTVLAIIIGVLLATAIAALWWDAESRQAELTALNEELSNSTPQMKAAKERLDRARYGLGFFNTRPPMLDCMREIALNVIHQDDRLWVMSFSLRDNGVGQLSGKAADGRTPIEVRDRMSKNPKFTAVTLTDNHRSGGTSPDWQYALSFTFKPAAQSAVGQPAATTTISSGGTSAPLKSAAASATRTSVEQPIATTTNSPGSTQPAANTTGGR